MPADRSVFVIIVNYNGGEMLMRCVESALAQDAGNISLVLVDNASVDGSAQAVMKRHPRTTLIQNTENRYFCKAANAGMAHAMQQDADYIFLLNNDATMMSDSLGQLLEFMERNQEVGACQPLLVFAHNPGIIQSAGCRLSRSGLAWDHLCGEPLAEAGSTPFPVLGATGGAMMLRTTALAEVGLFPESFEMYFEDVDLSLKLREADWEIFCVPQAVVTHIRSATADALGAARRIFFCERNSYAILKRHFPAPQRFLFLGIHCAFTTASAVKDLCTGKYETAWAKMKGTVAGLLLWNQRAIAEGNINHNIMEWADKRMYPPR